MALAVKKMGAHSINKQETRTVRQATIKRGVARGKLQEEGTGQTRLLADIPVSGDLPPI